MITVTICMGLRPRYSYIHSIPPPLCLCSHYPITVRCRAFYYCSHLSTASSSPVLSSMLLMYFLLCTCLSSEKCMCLASIFLCQANSPSPSLYSTEALFAMLTDFLLWATLVLLKGCPLVGSCILSHSCLS